MHFLKENEFINCIVMIIAVLTIFTFVLLIFCDVECKALDNNTALKQTSFSQLDG